MEWRQPLRLHLADEVRELASVTRISTEQERVIKKLDNRVRQAPNDCCRGYREAQHYLDTILIVEWTRTKSAPLVKMV